ncbi:xanthine dehydrogenase family protein molybdopterin-binding subunit [Marinibaculum pumilum]|uniref:Xanthine dehydrogenase family protein molybdopterin-binding subunit n=1 Tax=Marinibaculum pumilum TaxID=1766165 RepID=A0ABV7KU25_9PROT
MAQTTTYPTRNMGAPAARQDGRLKVTGQARYAADIAVPQPAHAHLVTSAIARGRVAGFDLQAARAVPGVLEIFTHENIGTIREETFFGAGGAASNSLRPLASPEIHYAGQIIAMVVADSLEAAQEAAARVAVAYDAESPTAGFDDPGAAEKPVTAVDESHEDPQTGDAEAAWEAAVTKIDGLYATPPQHHNPMELFSTTALWEGEQLTIYEPSQWVYGLKHGVARQLGIDPSDVRAVSPYVGGAFGSKATVTPRTAIVAQAARKLGRPVKLVVTRAQGYTTASYRAETRHRVRLAADGSGKLTAYLHEAWELTSRMDPYFNAGTDNTVVMYDSPNIWTRVNIVTADRNTPGFMRSPPEVPYMYALEAAMDELAVALAMDPVELRRRNDTMTSPISGARFTSRSLMQCYDAAAASFGWSERDPQPGSMRDGDWLVGWGCATATYPTQMSPATARIRLQPDGHVRVQVAGHDVGTGAYTVIAQQAAESLGVPLDKVEAELGDSDLPPGPVAGGSITTASVCSVVKQACEAINRKLSGGASAAPQDIAAAFENLDQAVIEEYAEWSPPSVGASGPRAMYKGGLKIVGGPMDDKVMFAFGAEFVEVRVHRLTREIRVPRITGAFAGGRIVNPRTARSQYLGGLVWGIGSALHEATEIDRAAARYVNDDISEYLIPVNADIQDVDIIMVPEVDEEVNPAGVKGIGELANVGTAAAIANAVYHATGIRIRELPIRLEKLLA